MSRRLRRCQDARRDPGAPVGYRSREDWLRNKINEGQRDRDLTPKRKPLPPLVRGRCNALRMGGEPRRCLATRLDASGRCTYHRRVEVLGQLHEPSCPLVRAATGAAAIECQHGFDACPTCDVCECEGRS